MAPSRPTGLQGLGGVRLHPFHEMGDPRPIPSREIFSLNFIRCWAGAFADETQMEVVHAIDAGGLQLANGITLPILMKQVAKICPAGATSTLFLVSAECVQMQLLIPYHVIEQGFSCAEIPEEYAEIQWWCVLVRGVPGIPTSPDEVLQLAKGAGAVCPNLLDEGWIVKDKLKQGSFAILYRIKKGTASKDASSFAMKVYNGSCLQKLPAHARRELEMLARVQGHRHIVGLHGIFQSAQDPSLPAWSVALDFCSWGDLSHLVKSRPQTEDDLSTLFLGLTSGLEHVHSREVVHRDVQPQHILIYNSARAVLTDFHLACLETETVKLMQRVGSPGYAAPEVLQGGLYSAKVDIFSLGSSLLFGLCGRNPFGRLEKEQLERSKLGANGLDPDLLLGASEQLNDFAELLLHVSPSCRPTAREARQHAWLRGQPLRTESLVPNLPRVARKVHEDGADSLRTSPRLPPARGNSLALPLAKSLELLASARYWNSLPLPAARDSAGDSFDSGRGSATPRPRHLQPLLSPRAESSSSAIPSHGSSFSGLASRADTAQSLHSFAESTPVCVPLAKVDSDCGSATPIQLAQSPSQSPGKLGPPSKCRAASKLLFPVPPLTPKMDSDSSHFDSCSSGQSRSPRKSGTLKAASKSLFPVPPMTPRANVGGPQRAHRVLRSTSSFVSQEAPTNSAEELPSVIVNAPSKEERMRLRAE